MEKKDEGAWGGCLIFIAVWGFLIYLSWAIPKYLKETNQRFERIETTIGLPNYDPKR